MRTIAAPAGFNPATTVLSATGLPLGATFDAPTGAFRWRPDGTEAGVYPGVTFTASNGPGTASQTVTIVVNEAIRPLSGRVRLAGGGAVTDAGVQVSGMVGDKPIAFTDRDGRYLLTGLAPRVYAQVSIARARSGTACAVPHPGSPSSRATRSFRTSSSNRNSTRQHPPPEECAIMPSTQRDPHRGPVRIRLILPDLTNLPWLRGIEERLVTRTTEPRRRLVLPKLVAARRDAPDAAARKRAREPTARLARQELVAAAIFGAVGLAITFGLMMWTGAIDLGGRP